MKWLLFSLLLTNYCFSQVRRDPPPPADEGSELILTINTGDIESGENYTIEYQDFSGSYRPGAIEDFVIVGLRDSDDIIITLPAGEEENPLKLVFNIVDNQIVNFRGRVVLDGETYDTNFDNESFFNVKETTITFFRIDQNTLPIANNIYLSLQNGLVFSPNDDGIYDLLFLVMEEDFNVTSVQITKLDGTVVFSTVDKYFEWNGRIGDEPLEQGVYNYTITIDDENLNGQFLVQY